MSTFDAFLLSLVVIWGRALEFDPISIGIVACLASLLPLSIWWVWDSLSTRGRRRLSRRAMAFASTFSSVGVSPVVVAMLLLCGVLGFSLSGALWMWGLSTFFCALLVQQMGYFLPSWVGLWHTLKELEIPWRHWGGHL